MGVSVIVTSFGSLEGLQRCLESLTAQQAVAEIVVSDCSPQDPGRELGSRFPSVRFLHHESKRRVPELRWSALPLTTGEIVAAVEARCVPDPDWARILNSAHERNPEAPAVSGPVRLAAKARAIDMGLYLCEYGRFAPPLSEGPSRELSGANLSYKRAALENERDIIDGGRWETLLHARWRAAGRPLVLSSATVEFRNTMSLADIVRQRYSYGRGYAADRVETRRPAVRVAYALATPLLPALLLWRILRDAARTGHAAMFLRGFFWCAVLTLCWSAGEAVGYLFGHSSRTDIY